MELFEAINGRRSVRKFKSGPVPEEALRTLIEAASMAPSGSNVQAWKFGLVTDPEQVRAVDRFSQGMGGNPPAIIAVCSDRRYALERCGEFAAECMARLDAAYASQNIMLAAHALGLGTCAIKSYNEPAIRRLLQLPERIELELLISLGYPDHEPRTPRRKGFDEIVFRDAWSAGGGSAEVQNEGRDHVDPSEVLCEGRDRVGSSESLGDEAPVAQPSGCRLPGAMGPCAMGQCSLAGDELFDLLVYMAASAAGLEKEPAIYGPLRLAEVCQRLACMMARSLDSAGDGAASAQAAHLRELADLINARKNDCMTDSSSFYGMLGDAVLKLAERP